MCCSVWPTKFSQTITGTWEVLVDGVINHVLWYQNRVGSGDALTLQSSMALKVIAQRAMQQDDWREYYADLMQAMNISERRVLLEVNRSLAQEGKPLLPVEPTYHLSSKGNALIIPLLGSWSSIRLLNAIDTPSLLTDISVAVRPLPVRQSSASYGGSAKLKGGGGGLAFMKFGIYDIVLAEDGRDVPAALQQIVPAKRPKINDDVFCTLANWYQCPMAVCCFNNADTGESQPLAFAFEPYYPDTISVYTLDGHDGMPPDPLRRVQLDHAIFVASYLTDDNTGVRVQYTDPIPDHLRPYVPERVMGMHVSSMMENGDLLFQTDAVRAGQFEGLRVLPPHAPRDVPRLGQTITRKEGYAVGS